MKYFIAWFMVWGAALTGFAQTPDVPSDKNEVEIIACQPKLKNATANFYFSWGYSVETNETGKVSKIEKTFGKRLPFIDEESFKSCVQKWTLKPGDSYFVSLNIGTNGPMVAKQKNYIFIRNNTESIKIILPDVIGQELIEK